MLRGGHETGHTLFIHTGFGVLLAAVSLPLVLRRIPMNHFFGVRVAAAFTSESRWYDINDFGGRLFFVYGVLVALLGVLAHDLAPAKTSPWFLAFAVGPLVLTPVGPRFQRHFTSTGDSWMNLIERFVGLITGKQARRGSYPSTGALEAAIRQHIDFDSQQLKPLVWIHPADSIFESLRRLCSRTCYSGRYGSS